MMGQWDYGLFPGCSNDPRLSIAHCLHKDLAESFMAGSFQMMKGYHYYFLFSIDFKRKAVPKKETKFGILHFA